MLTCANINMTSNSAITERLRCRLGAWQHMLFILGLLERP